MSKNQGSKKGIVDSFQKIVGKLKKHVVSLFSPMINSRKILLLMVVVAILSIAITSFVSVMLSSYANHHLPSLAVIKTIDVETYWDSAAQNKIDVIDWGEIEPGKSVDITFYLKSVSNFDVTVDLVLTDWSPPNIAEYVSITWDYDDSVLEPRELIQVTMSLSASSSSNFVSYLVENEITNFNVAIHFIATD
jgi:hypothetical protein